MNLQHISYQLGELNGKMDRVLNELKRIDALEIRTGKLENAGSRAIGWVAGASAVVALLVSVAFRFL